MKSAKPLPSSLDRRRFLCLSSIAAAAALAPASPGLEPRCPREPGERRSGGARPDLYGRWFAF
ncbi:MAG TPA: hypothetical protein VFV36_03335 [Candidatus Methylomirabilis sp.]|nr:hypothetical protein [Candidatus Methylomirabilis sp.]